MLLRLLREYLRPYWRDLTYVVGFQLVSTIAALYLPSLNGSIIDNGVAKGDTGYIVSTGVWMLAVTLVQISCSIAAVYFGSRTAMRFGRDLRGAIFGRVAEFSAREVNRFGAPSLITRNTNDVQQVQMLVAISATILVVAPIMAVGGIIMALREDAGLSWLVVVAVPVMLAVVGLILRKMVPQFRLMQRRIDRVNQILREQISGIRVVRAFVREPYERKRFGKANDELTDTALRTGRMMAMVFPVVMLVFNASSVAVLWFGSIRIENNQLQVGAMMAFLQYMMQILMSVMMATMMVMMVPRASVCADRIGEVLATDTSVRPPRHPARVGRDGGDLELRKVTFSYPGAEKPVLRDISFRVRAGQTTAVIGSTGAGKTTLVNLIPRLFDATGGAVLVDGADVREQDPDELWRRIGLVPQKPYLFSGTVASNLRYGNPDATDEELWRCLSIAQARDFVERFPEGLEAPIAQGGTNVSGGQRQRLAIARALVHRPAIYVFDDSFSALDVGTDARLRAALRPEVAHAAVVIVAQRVSSIMDADQIVVIENGRLVGLGRHEQLLTDSPTYAEIVASQLNGAAAAGVSSGAGAVA